MVEGPEVLLGCEHSDSLAKKLLGNHICIVSLEYLAYAPIRHLIGLSLYVFLNLFNNVMSYVLL